MSASNTADSVSIWTFFSSLLFAAISIYKFTGNSLDFVSLNYASYSIGVG